MNTSYLLSIDHHGIYSKKRMNLQPMRPIPVNYATAAIPTFAPYGTEYTPSHTTKIIGGRRISIPLSNVFIPKQTSEISTGNVDPDISPTKTIQNVHALDNTNWPQQYRSRFDTTYRTEFINRIRHPDQISKPIRNSNSSLNQHFVLPPISSKTKNETNRNEGSARSVKTEIQLQQPIKNQETLNVEQIKNEIPPLNFNNPTENSYNQQKKMINEENYVPREPILLTDYEETRLSEQIRIQLASSTIADKLKLYYQELTAYDPNGTGYIHYMNIKSVAEQLGLNLDDDTFRFAMCKFVSPDRAPGFVNYEDMIRYFGKCLGSIHPNPYGQQRETSPKKTGYEYRILSPQKQYQTRMKSGRSLIDDDDLEGFDPDERQVRVLLKQNLKFFDVNGSIDFDKLYRELKIADRNQSGVLNRQQIEEVVYKVRIPLQRTLIFQILERHCRAFARFYRWEAFVQYLKEQVMDLKEVLDRSSPVYTQNQPTRSQWLKLIRQEYNEKNRLEIIEKYITNNEGPRLESNNPSAWFTRFLRLANAMYAHRISTNKEQDFVLPREEARRLLRAYNHVYNLNIDEDKLQRVLDACARNGNTAIDDALRLLAK